MTPDQIRKLFRASAIALGLPLAAAVAAADAVSFAKLDANKDGYIDVREASASPKLVELFARADANKDGRLSREEFAAIASMLK
jgi:Ca2+-binding EF-hand superfamily protein